jgi:hypothetical protein
MTQLALDLTRHEAENTIGTEPPMRSARFNPFTAEDALGADVSPARRMQAALGREFGVVAAEAPQWPLRRTVAFVMFTCGAFWTAVYFAIAALVG